VCAKETYIYVKETCIHVKKDLQILLSKRNVHIRKKDLLPRQKRPAKMSKGTFVYVREQLLLLEVFICVCKRDLLICKRDLHTRQKRPTNISKGTNVYVKQQLLKVFIYVYKRNLCVCQTALKQVLLEVFICASKRDLHIRKRDLHTRQKRKTKKISKETCAYVKQQLLKVLKYICAQKRSMCRSIDLSEEKQNCLWEIYLSVK